MPHQKLPTVKYHQLQPQGALVTRIKGFVENSMFQNACVKSACLQIPKKEVVDRWIPHRWILAPLPIVIINLATGHCGNFKDSCTEKHAGHTAYLVVSERGIYQKCRAQQEAANAGKNCKEAYFLVGKPCPRLTSLLKSLIQMVDMLRPDYWQTS
jgi:hypothetical protein